MHWTYWLFFLPCCWLSAAQWSSPQAVSSIPAGTVAFHPIGLVNGEILSAVWLNTNTYGASLYISQMIFGVTQWSTPLILTTPNQNPKFPTIKLDADGDVFLLWQIGVSGVTNVIRFAEKPFSAPITSVVPVTLSVEDNATHPVLAVNSSGAAAAAWTIEQESNTIVKVSRMAGIGIAWSSPIAISSNSGQSPAVAIDGNGNITLLWASSDGEHYRVAASYWNAVAGTWTSPAFLSPSGFDVTSPQIIVDAYGNGTAVWIQSQGSSSSIQAALGVIAPKQLLCGAEATGPIYSTPQWTSPAVLANDLRAAQRLQMQSDAAGDAVAIWSSQGNYGGVVQATVRPQGGSWSAAQVLSNPSSNGDYPTVALDPSGNIAAAWSEGNGSTQTIQASTRSLQDAWSAPTQMSLSGTALSPSVTVGSNGMALLLWSQYTASGKPLIFSSIAPSLP